MTQWLAAPLEFLQAFFGAAAGCCCSCAPSSGPTEEFDAPAAAAAPMPNLAPFDPELCLGTWQLACTHRLHAGAVGLGLGPLYTLPDPAEDHDIVLSARADGLDILDRRLRPDKQPIETRLVFYDTEDAPFYHALASSGPSGPVQAARDARLLRMALYGHLPLAEGGTPPSGYDYLVLLTPAGGTWVLVRDVAAALADVNCRWYLARVLAEHGIRGLRASARLAQFGGGELPPPEALHAMQ